MDFARGLLTAIAAIGICASGIVSATTIYSNTISTAGSPNMPDRVTRDGTPSECGSPKAYPGDYGVEGNFAYQQAAYTNQGPARCVTFTVQANCSGNLDANQYGTFLVGYSGTFDPNNLATGYLGDTGSSGAPNQPVTLALNLAAGQSITLVVMAVNDDATNPPMVCTYFLDDNITRPVPAMSDVGLLITALSVGGFGFAYLRRRSARA